MDDENDENTAEFYEAETIALIEAKEFPAAQVFASLAISASIREAADLLAALIEGDEEEDADEEGDGEDADIVE